MKISSLLLAGLLWTVLATPRCWAARSATTLPAGNLTPNGAVLNATANPGGKSTSVFFQYGTNTNYGSLTTKTNIGSGNLALAVSQSVTDLLAGVSYHFRAVATNVNGTSLGSDLVFTPPVFTLTNSSLPGFANSSVAWGDFNNDGKLDIIVTGTDATFTPSTQVWENQGANNFTNLGTGLAGLPGGSSGSVAWGDFDNDGHWDFLVTGYAGLDASHFPILISQVWRNQGNGAFTNINAGLPGVDTGSAAWGDFYNDGNLDILLTGYSSTGAIAQIWRNLGNGTFTNINAGFAGVFYSSAALGDFDNDGQVDILLTGTTNGFASGAITQIWRNLGNGVFTNLNAGLPGVYKGAVAVGDFDNDGRLDILLTGYANTGVVAQVWRNLGHGAFTNINAGLPGISQGSVAAGDFDNDGNLDILLTGEDAATNLICQVWRNLGNGTFINVDTGLAGVWSGSASWADFDGDGRLDILLTGFDATNNPVCRLYHNYTAVGNRRQPRLINPVKLSDGHFQFAFKGQTGLGYRAWASTNGILWNALGAPRESSPGFFQSSDHEAAQFPSRFYRISSP